MLGIKILKKGKEVKAFSLGEIPTIISVIAFSAIIGAVLLLVVLGIQNSSTFCVSGTTVGVAPCTGANIIQNTAYNALGNAQTGIGNIFAQYPLLGTIVGLLLIASLAFAFLYFRSKGSGGL